jgi:hypothetical protein
MKLWMIIPIIVLLVGTFWGKKVGETPECGMFPLNPLFGFMIFGAGVIISIALVIGHFL